LPIAVLGWGITTDTNVIGRPPVFSYSITNGTTSVETTLSQLGTDSKRTLISFQIHAPGNQSVTLKDEGAALSAFFEHVPLDEDKLSSIKYVYFPGIQEPEVLERMETAVTASGKEVLTNGGTGALLLSSNAYRELADVLAAHGLQIESVSVEEVLTKTVTKHGQKFAVPVTAIVYLNLQPRGPTGSR
jgi:hypothetical protein